MFELERFGRRDLIENFADINALMKGRRFKLGVWRQTVARDSCEPIAVDFALAVRSGTYVLCDRGMENTSVQIDSALAIRPTFLIVNDASYQDKLHLIMFD